MNLPLGPFNSIYFSTKRLFDRAIGALIVGLGVLFGSSAFGQCNVPWCNPGPVVQEAVGTTTHQTYFSALHGENIGYTVYLPASYVNEPDRRYPLILMMAGYGSTEIYSISYSYLVGAMQILTMPEAVIVSLNGMGNSYWHDGAFSTGTSSTVQGYSTVMNEMIPHLEQTYRLGNDPDERAMVGFSMGGYGAFNIALRSGYFRTVVSLDGSLRLPGNESEAWLTSCYNDPELAAVQNIFSVLADNQATASLLHALVVRANPAFNDQQLFSEGLQAAGGTSQYVFLPNTPHDYELIMAQVSGQVTSFLAANLVTPVPIVVRLRALLDGPWTGPLMNGALASSGLLPLTEPYTALGYGHVGSGGGEQTTAGLLATSGADGIVDWVVIELRNKNNPAQVVATRSVLLQRDGDVVDASGRSEIEFDLTPDEYFIAVQHRNHLGIMTALPLPLNGSGALVDLSGSVELYGGVNAAKAQGGRLMMYAGDVDRNGVLRYIGSSNDRDLILSEIGGSVPTSTSIGYTGEDVNLDGVVRYVGSSNDRDVILTNIGGSVPTAVRVSSVP